MAEQTVELAPGESRVVSFETTPHEARSYQVSVNGLTGSFVSTEVPSYLVPCVYCRATFTTEEQLIDHMESKHRGKPYLVSAYLPQAYVEQSRPARLSTAPFSAKGYVPDNRYYQFLTYISSDAYAGGVSIRNPAGFYEVGASIRSYGVVPYTGYVYLGLGTYAIKTHCVLIVDGGLYWQWRGADTGLTIEVVEAPPPAPNVFISKVFVSPTTVDVGESVKITVVVANTGELTGSLTVTTTVNGVAIDTRAVTRTPGLWAGYFLYYTPGKAGTYQVEADGVTASFVVR